MSTNAIAKFGLLLVILCVIGKVGIEYVYPPTPHAPAAPRIDHAKSISPVTLTPLPAPLQVFSATVTEHPGKSSTHIAKTRRADSNFTPTRRNVSPATSCDSLTSGGCAPSDCANRNDCDSAYITSLCAGRDAEFTDKLATYLGTHPLNVRKGLGRYNALNLQTHEHWCELSPSARLQAIAIARTPKKSPGPQGAESNREWMLYTMSDAGRLDAGGYSTAVAQRRLLLPETERQANKRATEKSTSLSVAIGSTQTAIPQLAGLPASPAGWTNLSGYSHPVGRINDLLIDNVGTTTTRTMWAGTDGGGIWKTTDGGTTWVPVNDFNGSLAIGRILRSPRNGLEMYASTNPAGSHTYSPFGIMKSNDGGVTWTQLAQTNPGTNPDFQYVTHLAIHPAGVGGFDVLLAATIGGAYQSLDSGATWSKLAGTSRANFVGFHPLDGNRRAYALHDGNITITTNGNWASASTYTVLAGTTSAYTKFAFATSDVNVMYALVNGPGSVTSVLRSATAGSIWTPLAQPSGVFANNYLSYTGGLWVDPNNANRIAMVQAWHATTTDATTVTALTGWTQSNIGWTDFHAVVADPQYNGTTNKILYMMDDGGLYRFTDSDALTGGQYLALGMTITEAYTAAGRGGNVVLGAQDVGARHYRPAGPTSKWQLPNGPGVGDGAGTAADPTNPNILYGANQFQRLNRSTDGGVNTVAICQGITEAQCGGMTPVNAAFIAPFILDPNTPSTMLAGAGSLWRSNDVSTGNPPTWATIHSGVGSVIVAIAAAKTDSNIIWVAYANGAVYKTANGLAAMPTWTLVANAPAGSKLRIFIDPTNASRIFIGLTGFTTNRLHVTTNGGTSWSPVPGLPSASVFAVTQHPANPAWLYAGTAVGIFASQDGGTSWSASNEGPANVQVRDLNWYSELGNSADLLVATFGRGIWRAAIQAGSGFALNIAKAGAGSGIVTSNPVGINCGSGCSNIFTAASMVTLTATPDTGALFVGWSGGGCSGTGTCTVTMSSAQTVTATFDLLPEVFPAGCTMPSGWSTPAGATAGWSVANDRRRSGACSLKSNFIGNSSGPGNYTKAQLQVTGNFAAGNVSFYYNLLSEPSYDCLRFIVDNVPQNLGACFYGGNGASGDIQTWTQVTVPLSAGTHTLVWSYEKDYIDFPIGDAAWIDDVVLPPFANSGTMQFTAATQSVAESVGNAIVNVSRTGGSTGAVSVSYATSNGSAIAGSDFTGQAGSLSWGDGDSTNKPITIPINDDALIEANETFTVTLSSPVGATLGMPSVATITILDNDALSAPGAPTLNAAIAGNGQATLNFSPPMSNGGSPITSYTANCGGVLGTGAFSPITVSPLINNMSYSCSVTATNAIGTSVPSGSLMVMPVPGAALALAGVFSRKNHPGLGDQDIPIDTNQSIGQLVSVEPRMIGAGHRIVFRFNNAVTSITSSASTFGSASHAYSGNEVTVTLTGVPDNRRTTVSLIGVNGVLNPFASMGFLVGDVSSSRSVGANDISAVKARNGQPLNGSNFRYDLNVSGGINSGDVSAVKARSGLILP